MRGPQPGSHQAHTHLNPRAALSWPAGNQTPESDETTSGFRKIFGLGIKCEQVF